MHLSTRDGEDHHERKKLLDYNNVQTKKIEQGSNSFKAGETFVWKTEAAKGLC